MNAKLRVLVEKYPGLASDLIDMKMTQTKVLLQEAERILLQAKEHEQEASRMWDLVRQHYRSPLLSQIKDKQMPDEKKHSAIKNADGKPAVYFDEVNNNYDLITKEYSITIDATTGQFWIASDLEGAESIIQGNIRGYIPREYEVPGAAFDYVVDQTGIKGQVKRAKFSGIIYVEDLPVEVFESKKITKSVEENEKSTVEDKAKSRNNTTELKFDYPSREELMKVRAGQLKRPDHPITGKKLSRAERRAYNAGLRALYPEAFDAGGNWVGFTSADDQVHTQIETKHKDQSQQKANKEQNVLGLMGETGVGNTITKMTDKRIPSGFMIARFFPGKGYGITSTPAKDGEFSRSALIICNKERTGKFMLSGLMRNKSFSEKVDGCDIFKVSELKKKFFEDDTMYVYYVTNAVTALQALGTQSKILEEIKSKVES